MKLFIYQIFAFMIAISLYFNNNTKNTYSNNENNEEEFKMSIDYFFKRWNCSSSSQNNELYLWNFNLNNTKFMIFNRKSKIKKVKYSIFSMAFNYKIEKLSVFINSLRATKYRGRIFLFVNDNISDADLEYLELNRISPVFVNDDQPYYSKRNTKYKIEDRITNKYNFSFLLNNKIKYSVLRYILLLIFLKQFHNEFEYVLVIDIRDVFFQHNPFQLDLKKGITLFEESRRANWSKLGGYTKELLLTSKYHFELMKKFYIINGGAIYFTISEGLLFLESFYKLVVNSNRTSPSYQVLINILVYNIPRKYTIYIYPNLFGPIKAMANERGEIDCVFPKEISSYRGTCIYINSKNKLVNIGGIEPLIIHSNWIFNENEIIKIQRNIFES